MATIVSFHAHPDDESIATGGLLARAADAGHRVVLVFATRGEIGEPTNDAAWCFWQADLDHAARRLAVLLDEERPEVLTVYDDNGGYGHPDHIQVHRVGHRAAELAGVPVVAESSMNRDLITRARAMAKDMGVDVPDEPQEADGPEFGKPESAFTHVVHAAGFVDRKRASMLAHASQIGPDHFMANMPPEAFEFIFGNEYFIVHGADRAPEASVFAELFAPFDASTG